MALPPVTTGLVYALQADTLALADGAAVASWPDSTSNHNDPTVHSSLAFGASRTPLGTPAVVFGGSGYLTMPDNMLSASTAAEMFWVLRSTKSGDDNPGLYVYGGSDRTYWPGGGSSSGCVFDGALTATRFQLQTISAADTHSWHVYNVSHDGTTWRAYLDGELVFSAATGYVAPTTFVIGTNFLNWVGDIAESELYSRALTATERSDVLDYLYTKHIAATLPRIPQNLDPLITASAFSGEYDSGQWSHTHVFDDDLSTHWADYLTHTVYAQAQFTDPMVVTRYDLNAGQWSDQAPAAFTFAGSNDAVTWSTLDSQSGQTWSTSGQTRKYTIASPQPYLYYRWACTANVNAPGGTVNINGLALRGHSGPQMLDAPPIDLTIDLPRPPQLDAPPIDLTVDLPRPQQLDAPPMELSVDLTGSLLSVLFAPPVELALTARPATLARIQRVRLRPEPATTVPVPTPVFVADFTVLDGDLTQPVTIDIQIDTDDTFASPTQLSATVEPLVGVNTVRLTPAGPLSPGGYVWRLRANGGAWTPLAWPFTVPATVPATTIPMTWTVTSGATDPWIWFIYPDWVSPGDTITIVGQGFAADSIVQLGDIPLEAVTVTQNVTATDQAATPGRTIDRLAPAVDPEHDEIVATVPASITDSGPITVTDGS